jgi:perosamine synthetase
MDPILELAEHHSLHVIEDAAEAHGAEYKKKKVGSLGVVGCYSFYGNKIVTSGEGGMITTNNEEIVEKIFMLRDHAMSRTKRYWHPMVGYNYRMTNMQAAVGLAQVERIEHHITAKRNNADMYNSLLNDVPNITPPPEMKWARNVFWLYSILVDDADRDKLMVSLREKGIDTRPFFYPMHIQPPYQGHTDEDLKVACDLAARGLSLPSATTLKRKQIKYICETLAEAIS